MKGLKINYTINNFSELIEVYKYTEFAPKSKKIGVYFLYSEYKELLYIGKSVNCIRQRLCNHLITRDPAPYNDVENNWMLEKRINYHFFAYSEIEISYIDMVERFLINKYKPKYNIEFNY